MTTEMQVEESMIHFPSQYPGVDSPSSTAFGSPAISECGAVDPAKTLHGCFVPPDFDGVADFSAAEGQLYAMQQSSPAYSMADFDLNELENIIGPVMEVEQGMVVSNGAAGSPGRPLDGAASLHETARMRAVHATELERSNSMSLAQQHPPRLQHRLNSSLSSSLSMRVVSSSSPAARPSGRTGRLTTNGSGGPRNQVRASKPVFPTESVPLQQVSRRERPPSATPSVFSTRSDPFDTRSTCASIGVASDPGYAYSVRSRDSGRGSVCSAPGILDSSSPGEYLDGPGE